MRGYISCSRVYFWPSVEEKAVCETDTAQSYGSKYTKLRASMQLGLRCALLIGFAAVFLRRASWELPHVSQTRKAIALRLFGAANRELWQPNWAADRELWQSGIVVTEGNYSAILHNCLAARDQTGDNVLIDMYLNLGG